MLDEDDAALDSASMSALSTQVSTASIKATAPFVAPPSVARRRFLLQGAAVGAVAVLAAGGVYLAQQDTVSHALSYTSSFGEQKIVTLPDGSEVHMNVSTELVLHYQEHRRQLTLLKGEATFAVQNDKNRPFIVDAGQVQVEVTGTVFNVRRHAEGSVEVAVTEGSVQVSSGPWWNRKKVSLTPGMLAQGGGGTSMVGATSGCGCTYRLAARKSRVPRSDSG